MTRYIRAALGTKNPLPRDLHDTDASPLGWVSWPIVERSQGISYAEGWVSMSRTTRRDPKVTHININVYLSNRFIKIILLATKGSYHMCHQNNI